MPADNVGEEDTTFDEDCDITVNSEDLSSVETEVLVAKVKKMDGRVKVGWDTQNPSKGCAPVFVWWLT